MHRVAWVQLEVAVDFAVVARWPRDRGLTFGQVEWGCRHWKHTTGAELSCVVAAMMSAFDPTETINA